MPAHLKNFGISALENCSAVMFGVLALIPFKLFAYYHKNEMFLNTMQPFFCIIPVVTYTISSWDGVIELASKLFGNVSSFRYSTRYFFEILR